MQDARPFVRRISLRRISLRRVSLRRVIPRIRRITLPRIRRVKLPDLLNCPTKTWTNNYNSGGNVGAGTLPSKSFPDG